jgi:hypothetical protein
MHGTMSIKKCYKVFTKTEIKTSLTQTVSRAPDIKLKLATLNINN